MSHPQLPPTRSEPTRRRRRARHLPVVVALAATSLALALATTSASGASTATTSKTPTIDAYVSGVAGSGATPIDTATNTAGTTIAEAGGPACFTPGGGELLAPTPTGVDVINTARNKVLKTIPDPSDPYLVVMAPNGKTAYAVNRSAGTVLPINVAKETAGAPIVVGSQPEDAVVTADSATVLVADEDSNAISVISVSKDKVVKTIEEATTDYPISLTLTPNGKTAYVVNELSVSNQDGNVVPLTVATEKPGSPITVGHSPFPAAVTPSGSTLFVPNAYSDTVSVISTATNKLEKTIPVGSAPHDTEPESIVVTPNGLTAYVSLGSVFSDAIDPISVKTLQAGTAITVGAAPQLMAVTPNSKTLYVTNSDSGSVSPVNTSTDVAGTPITVGGGAYEIAMMPAPFVITTGSLPKAAAHHRYSARLAASGAIGAVTWSLAKGKLPTGLSLKKSGEITGTPTTSGKSSFTVEVTDASGVSVTAALEITVG